MYTLFGCFVVKWIILAHLAYILACLKAHQNMERDSLNMIHIHNEVTKQYVNINLYNSKRVHYQCVLDTSIKAWCTKGRGTIPNQMVRYHT